MLTIRRTPAGAAAREPRVERVGAGLEFADHRDYAAGDDLRYLDWNLYGRLERLALRLFEEDEDLSSTCSSTRARRWALGDPPKLDLALQIGAALGYVALANLDRVAFSPLGDDDAPVLPRPRAARARSCRSCGFSTACRRTGASGSRRRCGRSCPPPRAPARAGDRHLRLLRSGRPPRGAGSAAAPPAGGRRDPGERAARRWRPTCTATSSCATSRPASRAS